jgi:hypothetical protein
MLLSCFLSLKFMNRKRFLPVFRHAALFLGLISLTSPGLFAQSELPLNDLSAFKNPPKSWRIAGDVSADLNTNNTITTSPGTGVLVNISTDKEHGADIFSNLEHGDVDIELDYLIAKGSNSGIYLQGLYEIQLLDSWGVKSPRSGDNAGIYERWDESKPEGQKGYGGIAPRQNASKAPGLWQHMKISFQAPRFATNGTKIENARILLLELNGVILHENVELLGPTRGSMSAEEKPKGPLRIQGDHGSVAFRNIRITAFDKPKPEITNLNYSVYKGRYQQATNFAQLPPEARGTLPVISANAISGVPTEFFINYTGNIKVTEPGRYNFNILAAGGRGVLKVNGKEVTPTEGGRGGGRVTLDLPAGETPFELLYIKTQDWSNRGISIGLSGPGIREYFLGDAPAGFAQNNADPILVEAPVNTLLRSFVDIPGGTRVTHAINVGSADQVHYTYDLDKGSIVQVWRGGFLDATPMWYSRGDGSSRPRGMVQRFGAPVFTISRLAAADAPWTTDTTGSGFISKGYRVDKSDVPVFRYMIHGASVEDAITPLPNSQGLQRTISLQNASGNFYARLAEGNNITALPNGVYVVDDKAYYLQINDAGNGRAAIRDANGRKQLIVPVQNKITYSILF